MYYTYYEQDGGLNYDTEIGFTTDLTPVGGTGAGLYYNTYIPVSNSPNGASPNKALSIINYYFKAWERYPGFYRDKNYGDFNYNNVSKYSKLPLFCNEDCALFSISQWNQNNDVWYDSLYDAGRITLNLTVTKDIQTPDNWNYLGNRTYRPPITIMGGEQPNSPKLTISNKKNLHNESLYWKFIWYKIIC